VLLKGPVDQANAGIQIRSLRVPDSHEMSGYQADVGQHYWGALYDESRRNTILAAPPEDIRENLVRPDDWNRYRIRCQGPRVQLWLNDVLTVDYLEADAQIDPRGRIGLQVHGGPPTEAWYRNIEIEELVSGVVFRAHPINPDSAFEAAGIADLDRDGTPDIFCGTHWYRGPDWAPREARSLEPVSGYYNSFAAVPADIDGDGWPDIVDAAWFTQDVFWLRNPGAAGGAWTQHEVDKPGNIETLGAAEVDGDGQLDMLPNTVSGTSWYSYATDATAEGGARWTKHALPGDVKGHGFGSGDIDGDGRCDLITPQGWWKQSGSRTEPTWTLQAEFHLGDSASIPVLVCDPDGDGDADLVCGMAHAYGIFWLEQGRDGQGARTWTRHDIENSWSQAHFLLLVDVDLDGKDEVVTGKRYHAHNGGDPGGNDPQIVVYYDYDSSAGAWTRHVMDDSGSIGFGIFTMAADLDADGDLDVVCPGKGGLYWLENLLK